MTRGTLVPVAVIAALFAVFVIRPAGQSAPRRAVLPVEATIEPLAQPTRGGNASSASVSRTACGRRRASPTPLSRHWCWPTMAPAPTQGPVTASTPPSGPSTWSPFAIACSRCRGPTPRCRRAPGATARSVARRAARSGPVRPRRQFTFEPWGYPALISSSHSLLIRALRVVEDASGNARPAASRRWASGASAI